MANILIGDDHAVVRMAVRILLESAGHHVVGEVDCGLDVVEQVKRQKPDLIILDIDLPKLDGLSVLNRLRTNQTTKVVIYSALSTDQYAIRTSRAGAHAFISKEDDLKSLLTAVQAVQAGYTVFPVTENSCVAHASNMDSEQDVVRRLSAREISVLRYLARGHKIKEIAEALMIGQKSISTYKSRLRVKLKLGSEIELIEFARRNGLT